MSRWESFSLCEFLRPKLSAPWYEVIRLEVAPGALFDEQTWRQVGQWLSADFYLVYSDLKPWIDVSLDDFLLNLANEMASRVSIPSLEDASLSAFLFSFLPQVLKALEESRRQPVLMLDHFELVGRPDYQGTVGHALPSFLRKIRNAVPEMRLIVVTHAGSIALTAEASEFLKGAPSYLFELQEPSVLVIGHSLAVDVECIEWDSPEPNVADYDIVIMDLTTAHTTQLPPPQAYSVQPRLHQVDMSKYLQWPHIRRSVGRLLLSGGRLFVITNPEIVISPHSARVVLHHARSTTLLPFLPFGERVPAGQSMKWVDPRFDFYFQEVGQWNFILTGKLEYFYEHFDDQVTCQVHPLAQNRAGEMIGLSVSVWGDRTKTPGVIYILHPPTKITSAEAIELLIAHLDNLCEIPTQYIEEAQQIQEQVPISTKPAVTAKRPSLSQEPLPQEKPMRGIPQILLLSLRQALMVCDEFHSPRQLYAILGTDELKQFQARLPGADNLSERVDVTIEYLADNRRAGGESALVLFLRLLGERYDPGDERHDHLIALADQLEWLHQRPPQPEAAVLEANPQAAQMLWVADAEKMLACARAVARVEVPRFRNGRQNGKSTGTGWLVAPGLALTCWHVVEALGKLETSVAPSDLQAQFDNTLLTFDYTVAGKGLQYRVAAVEHPTVETKMLDYTVLRLVDRSDAPLRERGYLRLDIDAPLTAQTSLYIIQHPLGQPQQSAGDTFVRFSPTADRILYKTPTEPGTSGAPVLNRINWRVVALHNGENEAERLREGTLIKSILADLEQHRPDLYREIMSAQSAKE